MIAYLDPAAFLSPPLCKCGKPLRECLREPCAVVLETVVEGMMADIAACADEGAK